MGVVDEANTGTDAVSASRAFEGKKGFDLSNAEAMVVER